MILIVLLEPTQAKDWQMQKSTVALELTNRFEGAEKIFVRIASQPLSYRAVFAASLGAFLLICIEWFNVNDFMYGVSAAVWDQNGRLYTDVPFVQAPLSIILNLLVIKLLGTVDIFLFARIASILFVLGAVLVPPFLYKERPSAIWAIFIAVCLTNPYVHSNSREIGNYSFPLLCLSFAVTIIETRLFLPRSRGFLACAAIAIATSTKLYFAVMCPAIILLLLITEKEVRQPKNVAACLAGFSLGLSPILFFLIRDHQGFLKWTVYVFFDFLKTRESTMMGGVASLTQALEASLQFLGQMLIPFGFTAIRLIEECRQPSGPYLVVGRLVVLISAYVMAVAPGFVNDQYLAPLALLMFLFSVPGMSSSDLLRSRYIICFLVLFLTQIGIMLERGVTQYLNGSRGFDVVEAIRIKNRAHEIVDAGYKCERQFYSAEPLFLLDHRVRYPRELAAGPFLLFLGRRDLRKIGADFDVTNRIKQWKPDIVVWGYFVDSTTPAADEVDRIVRTYAVQQNFKVVPLGSFDQRDIYLGYRRGCRE